MSTAHYKLHLLTTMDHMTLPYAKLTILQDLRAIVSHCL